MGAGQERNAIVALLGIEAEEQTASPLVVRRLERRDGRTESGRERLTQGGKTLRVEHRVEAHELGAGHVATVDGLDEGDLDLWEAGSLE